MLRPQGARHDQENIQRAHREHNCLATNIYLFLAMGSLAGSDQLNTKGTLGKSADQGNANLRRVVVSNLQNMLTLQH